MMRMAMTTILLLAACQAADALMVSCDVVREFVGSMTKEQQEAMAKVHHISAADRREYAKCFRKDQRGIHKPHEPQR